ncbi:MAG TPA: DNA ligase D [Casimicrobiaceae bacterium]|nr:DNA ligase D [Casimicrobiaceae bacterium]
MGLERYREKRNFRATPEPRGRIARGKAKDLSFVIQKHAASHLHYDFRLELNGVLLSWAVPKGPSLDPHDKRLAMHVEDHPLEYGGFEGIIPPRQYGSGTVMVWDRGTWHPIGDPVAGYQKGHLKFELDGEKLKGGWALIRTHGSKYGGKSGKQAWLLIKESDEYAKEGNAARIVDDEPDSVVSGRSLEEIARDKANEWHSNRSVAANVRGGALADVVSAKSRKPANPTTGKTSRSTQTAGSNGKNNAARVSPASAAGAKKARMPASLSPTLATLVDSAPTGDDWIHEIKFDGYRMVSRIDHGEVRVYSRNGKEWTAMLPSVVAALQRLDVDQAWLDGEIAVADAQGLTSFQQLQNALSNPRAKNISYFVFDLLYQDGCDLRGVALTERKRLLRALVGKSDAVLRYSVDVQGSGAEFFEQACKLKLEGAVSKRADSVYREGVRTRDWLKVKCGQRQEMVIGGFTDPQGSRSGFGALLLGIYEGGKLRYAGKVGTGFDDKTLTKLRPVLGKLEQKEPPFVNPPRGFEAKGAHWVKPQLVAEIAFTEWSNDGALRHPSFQGLREDKKATDVVRERAAPVKADDGDAQPRTRKGSTAARAAPARAPSARAASPRPISGGKAAQATTAATDTVAGIKLSHPDKPLFPEAKLVKRDLALYYEAIADWILPHLRDRPLALVRCPDGWSKQCFFQKHADKSVNAAVTRVQVPEGDGTATYFAANSLPALVALVQWGVVELHPWGSRAPKLDRPDRLIFDFDPDDGIGWKQIVEAVGVLRALLDDLGLEGFLKTTGGKGLHVVVPIRPTLDWTQAKGFTKAVADLLVGTFPDRFIATLSKAQRKGKIFIDYLRNAEGATAIAPYAIRARAKAPVSTPIAWSELDTDVRFDHFNVRNIPERLRALRQDPWASIGETRQTVTRAMFKRVRYEG